jgi:hypothetical protein
MQGYLERSTETQESDPDVWESLRATTTGVPAFIRIGAGGTADTAKAVWDALKRMYKERTRMTTVELVMKFRNKRCGEGETYAPTSRSYLTSPTILTCAFVALSGCWSRFTGGSGAPHGCVACAVQIFGGRAPS